MFEINQAGLSWITILKKAEKFCAAYSRFNIKQVASYDEKERARLLNDAGIIRNRLNLNAAIVNAQKIQELQREFGSFKSWLDSYHPQSLEQ